MSIISLSFPPFSRSRPCTICLSIYVDLYRYLIGREDQSVNEQVMIKRIDQQLKVNRLLVDPLNLSKVSHPKMREYLLNHIEITTVISSACSTEQAQQSILPKNGSCGPIFSRKIQRSFRLSVRLC